MRCAIAATCSLYDRHGTAGSGGAGGTSTRLSPLVLPSDTAVPFVAPPAFAAGGLSESERVSDRWAMVPILPTQYFAARAIVGSAGHPGVAPRCRAAQLRCGHFSLCYAGAPPPPHRSKSGLGPHP